jgi:ATPase subunit of ABC transporter with duplicated ATPase domains
MYTSSVPKRRAACENRQMAFGALGGSAPLSRVRPSHHFCFSARPRSATGQRLFRVNENSSQHHVKIVDRNRPDCQAAAVALLGPNGAGKTTAAAA